MPCRAQYGADSLNVLSLGPTTKLPVSPDLCRCCVCRLPLQTVPEGLRWSADPSHFHIVDPRWTHKWRHLCCADTDTLRTVLGDMRDRKPIRAVLVGGKCVCCTTRSVGPTNFHGVHGVG